MFIMISFLSFIHVSKLTHLIHSPLSSRTGTILSKKSRAEGRNNEAIICLNPGGEEQWQKIVSAHVSPGEPIVMLNNAYSTSYDVGNQKGFEEAYYLKRISKGM